MNKPSKPPANPADPILLQEAAQDAPAAPAAKKAATARKPAPAAKKAGARPVGRPATAKAAGTAPAKPATARKPKAAARPKAPARPKVPSKPKVPSRPLPDVATVASPPASAKPSLPNPPTSEASVDFEELQGRMLAMQQVLRAQGIPVVIVFEGWDASGKGTMLGELLEGLDPRGYQVHVMDPPTGDEKRYPPFRRYWMGMPAQGNLSLFVGSWYQEVSAACLRDKNARKQLPQRFAQIIQMESQLVCNGTLLIKFFLNVSKKEQKARLKELESKKSTRWRATKEAWEQNEHYDDMMHLYDAMIAQTDFQGALWHVLRSEDKRACKKQMYDIVLGAFESAIASSKAGDRSWDLPALPHVKPMATEPMSALDTVKPYQPVTGDYKQAMDQAQKRLRRLHSELYRRRIPLIVGFEGWDAAGKGGAIRRLTSALDARGFMVCPTSAPTPEEKSHHHLWRFWNQIAKDGHIAIFDRTWYGRVMVERVEGFCTQAQWQRAYEEINQFEQELAQHGAIVRKFWLQIDRDVQLARFKDRQKDPEKQWKITDEDWRNREKWPQYEAAVNEMLQRTHTQHAPWTVVEADNKQYARLKVLHTLIEAIEERLKK